MSEWDRRKLLMEMAAAIEFMPELQDLRFACHLGREPEGPRFDPLQAIDPEESDLAGVTQSFLPPRHGGARGLDGLFGGGYRKEESLHAPVATRGGSGGCGWSGHEPGRLTVATTEFTVGCSDTGGQCVRGDEA